MKDKKTFKRFEKMESIASKEGWSSDFGEDIVFYGLKNELRNGNDNMTLKEFVDKIEKEFNEGR